ncbi:MAG TPA: dihydrodipicolinate synthase family protein [Nitrospinae bacterium]|nr:dihydrodipicolinate synthase family protein [Nitrospinota bacterium]
MEYTKTEAKAYCKEHMKGIWAALTTPFAKDGSLDEQGLRANVRTCIDDLKIDGFFCNGLMGEYWSLSPEERRRAQHIVCEESQGKAQVIPHTAHINLTEAVELTKHAEEVGADYAILINPIYGAHDDDEIFLYFKTLCDQVDIGISLFNQPKSGTTLSPELIERLADIDNICCIKNAVPSMAHQMETRRRVGDRIVVCDPNEEVLLVSLAHLDMQVHMSSPCPYLYQVPGYSPIRDYYDAAMAGDMKKAWEINYSLEPLRAVRKKYFTTGPNGRTTAFIKEWTTCLGLPAGDVRPPVVSLTQAEKDEFRKDLEATGLLDKVKA